MKWIIGAAPVCYGVPPKWTVFEFQSEKNKYSQFFDNGNHVLKFKLCNGLKFNTEAHVTIL